MGALANTKTILTAAVANGGTLVIAAYPAGSTQASLNGKPGGRVTINDSDTYPEAASGTGTVLITYGASTITITNNSGVTWPAGASLIASFGRTDRNGVYNLVLGTTADTAKAGNL